MAAKLGEWLRQRRGPVRRLAALLAVVGLAAQLALPGLDLAFLRQADWAALSADPSVCHTPGTSTAQNPGESGQGPRAGHDCCVLCVAAQAAKGAMPAVAIEFPEPPRAEPLSAAEERTAPLPRTFHHKLPRAPPAA